MHLQHRTLRRAWRVVGVGLILFVIWASLTPHPISIPVEQGDKVGHFAAYGTLMFWFAQLDARQRTRMAYAIAFVALGIALEFAQRLTDYRMFEVADMVANAIGVIIGWVASPPRGPDILGFAERML